MAFVCECGFRAELSAEQRQRLAASGGRAKCPKCGKINTPPVAKVTTGVTADKSTESESSIEHALGLDLPVEIQPDSVTADANRVTRFENLKRRLPLIVSSLALLVSVASFFRPQPRHIQVDSILVGKKDERRVEITPGDVLVAEKQKGPYIALTSENDEVEIIARHNERRATLWVSKDAAVAGTKVGNNEARMGASIAGPTTVLISREDQMMSAVTEVGATIVTATGKDLTQSQALVVRTFR
ncbi:MAG: hypothetical protein ACKV2Q_11535 [Planctomycetaceae bacterium]